MQPIYKKINNSPPEDIDQRLFKAGHSFFETIQQAEGLSASSEVGGRGDQVAEMILESLYGGVEVGSVGVKLGENKEGLLQE